MKESASTNVAGRFRQRISSRSQSRSDETSLGRRSTDSRTVAITGSTVEDWAKAQKGGRTPERLATSNCRELMALFEAGWDKAIQTRTQAQNEYVRIGGGQ